MTENPRPDEEHFGEASLGDAQPDIFVPGPGDPYINEDADPLQHWQGREITVVADPPQTVQVDGEIMGQTPITARVVPGAVRVIVPRMAAAPGA